MWIIVAILAAILLIGGTVWFLRSSGGTVPAFISNITRVAPAAENQYDKPSRFSVSSSTRKFVPPDITKQPADVMQLPATLTP